jgi:hypothetical protein
VVLAPHFPRSRAADQAVVDTEGGASHQVGWSGEARGPLGGATDLMRAAAKTQTQQKPQVETHC